MQDQQAKTGWAVVTGASSGIGLEIARCCAKDGYDLVIAADDSDLARAAAELTAEGAQVEHVVTDLATEQGVVQLLDLVGNRPVEVLVANAGHGLGHAFLDQDFGDIAHVIETNVTGTARLVHAIGRKMRQRGRGRILITGSIAGFIPGPFQAVYNASKAFVDSFGRALRNELQDTGISVTVLMPGATDTAFFERADLLDTKIGQADKDDPAEVAKAGYEAMCNGEAQVITGLKNKLQVAAAHVAPAGVIAEQHRKQAEPGSASR